MHPDSTPEQLLRFRRASHSDGADHRIIVRSFDLRPLSCSCQAGVHGKLCWAVLDVTASELVPIARERWLQACGMDEIKTAARVLSTVNRWQKAAAELQALRSCGYVPVRHHQEVVA